MSNNNFTTKENAVFIIDRIPSVLFKLQRFNLPTVTLGERLVSNRHTDYNIPGDKIFYDKIDLEFIVDEELENYQQALDWITAMRNPKSFAHRDFVSDAAVKILSNNKNPIKTYIFRDCYPSSLSEVNFDYTSEVEYTTCTLTLSYTYFVLEGTDESDEFNPSANGPRAGVFP